VVADGLFMPIDVAQGPDGTVWVLEFADFDDDASCFTGEGYQANTGRLSRLTEDGLEVVIDGLDRPGAVLPASDGTLYVTEVYAGRVVAITVEPLEGAGAVLPQVLTDVASEVGLDFEHGAFRFGMSEDPIAAMGAGLCWLDYDADGWMDLYLVNSYSLDEEETWTSAEGLPSSQLYRNVGGRFERVDFGSSLTVRGNGCITTDFNADGWTDIYVTADGANQLLLNVRGARFEEVAGQAGVDTAGWSTAAAAADINGDGLVDLFVAGYVDLAVTVDKPTGHFPQDHPGIPDHLYIGTGVDGDGVPHFEEMTTDLGLTRSERGLGAVLTDLDLDGDLDLYVANDGDPNRLYVNDTAGAGGIRFVDVTDAAAVGDSGSGMGIAAGDYDSDGLPDLLVTNWSAELHALYRSEGIVAGRPVFAYSTYRIGLAGLGNNQTGWGTAWLDVDHDTDLDLLVVNGHVPVEDLSADAETMRLYVNQTAQGESGQFADGTGSVGLDKVGVRLARGSAVADFDNDGDLDVAVNQIGGPVTLLRNEVADGNWLLVVTEGYEPGTTVEVVSSDGWRLRRELLAGSSYLASEDPRLHFGLADVDTVDVKVRWPDGTETEVAGSGVNRILVVERP
ncbi:MAG: FG-GAP-like repeat-containing protein, partial [Acidimicrobiia bacterium]|nr:FG-GAP-like repeat-containing protein [Acidimicrobiia bacterium]